MPDAIAKHLLTDDSPGHAARLAHDFERAMCQRGRTSGQNRGWGKCLAALAMTGWAVHVR